MLIHLKCQVGEMIIRVYDFSMERISHDFNSSIFNLTLIDMQLSPLCANRWEIVQVCWLYQISITVLCTCSTAAYNIDSSGINQSLGCRFIYYANKSFALGQYSLSPILFTGIFHLMKLSRASFDYGLVTNWTVCGGFFCPLFLPLTYVQIGGALTMKYVQMGVLLHRTLNDFYKKGYILQNFL